MSDDQERNQVGATAGDLAPELLALVRSYLRDLLSDQRSDDKGRQAWEHFFRICDPVIRAMACRWLHGASDQCDCAQEIWLHLLRKLPDSALDGRRGNVRGWLFILARNRAIDYLRSEAHWRQWNRQMCEDALASRESRRRLPLEQRSQLRLLLRELRKRHGPLSRRLVFFRYCREFSVRQVARRLHLSECQAEGRLRRLKPHLQELLRERRPFRRSCRAHR